MKGKEKFDRYKQIKKEINTNYKSYPIEKIIALDLIVRVYVKRNYTLKSLIGFIVKRVIPLYFSTLNISGLKINAPKSTLFTMGVFGRKDYYEIWDYAKSSVENKISFDFSKQDKKAKLNVRNIIRSWDIINKTKRLNFLDKMWLAAKITHYLNFIDDLESIEPVVGKYCAFSSVHEYETVLTYYFKKKKVKTYSLQHGALTVYKKHIPLDAFTYENFSSDFHLCWGQSSKDELIEYGIKSESLIVAGYPRETDRPPVPKHLDKKHCIVLLARYSYNKTNLRLIEVLKSFAEKHQIKVHLKLHPSLYWNNYWTKYEQIALQNNWIIEPKKATISDLLLGNKFGWAIAVNTSAYYESYIYNLPCLRFNDGTFEDTFDVMDDTFGDIEGLEKSFKQIPFDNSERIPHYFKGVNEKLDYAIDINTNQYDVLSVKQTRTRKTIKKKQIN